MSKEAAAKLVNVITWGRSPDWYKQLIEEGYTREKFIRAAAENGYEFTEEEYDEQSDIMQAKVNEIR